MTRTPTAHVTPEVLAWARKSAGFDITGAANKAHVGQERLEAWEAGDSSPSIAQLRTLARIYKRPLAAFFLSEPPSGWDVMRDFRRLPDAGAERWSPPLHAEFRRAQEQRDAALELLELVGEDPPTAWQVQTHDDDSLAASARATLRDRALLGDPTSANGYDRFAYWSSGLEEAGVLVITSDGVETSEMRGFSIYEAALPVVVVNGKDAINGRIFSLLHEYAHLLLHTGGLCDQRVPERPEGPDRQLEARCNALAAAILMPADVILRDPVVASAPPRSGEWTDGEIRSLAARFGVSGEAALRRLVELGKASRELYEARRAEWQEIYDQAAERRTSTGGEFYRTRVRNLGKGYVRLVMDAYTSRSISSYEAASYLNAKVSQLPRLAKAAGVTGGA